MKLGKILGIVAIVCVLAVIFTGFSSYNGLATMREELDAAQSDIQTQLQRRADLIPNLVNTVQGLSAQEQSIVDSVTTARAALVGAQGMQEQAQANDQLSSALSRLLVVVENYPEIKSDTAYVSLMDELSGTENRIATARTDYNSVVKTYNSKLVRLPAKLFANLFGFEKAEYFQAADSAQTPPTVDFGTT